MRHVRKTILRWRSPGVAMALAGAVGLQGCNTGPESEVSENVKLIWTTTSSIPYCTGSQIQDNEWVMGEQQTVDVPQTYIGNAVADSTGIQNWYPVSGYTRTLCGRLHNFKPDCDGHGDVCWEIIPNALFTDIVSSVPSDDTFTCGTTKCLEAEIAPPPMFVGTNWFDSDAPLLEGKTMCVDGPWVKDGGHKRRPEIHPSDVIWFSVGQSRFVLVMRDDSGRFDDRDDYYDIPSGTWWRPWALEPVRKTVRQYFKVPPSKTHDFGIWTLEKNAVVTSGDASARLDSDSGSSVVLMVDGRPVVRVFEETANDNDLGVTIPTTSLCRDWDNTIRGRVEFRTKVHEKGYHWFVLTKVERTRPLYVNVVTSTLTTTLSRELLPVARDAFARASKAVDLVTPAASVRTLAESLSRSADTGELLADRTVQVTPNFGSRPEDVEIVSVAWTDGKGVRPLSWSAKKEGQLHVVGVPETEGFLELVARSGRRMKIRTFGMAVYPQFEAPVPLTSRPASAAWPVFARLAGGLGNDSALSPLLHHVPRWSVGLTPGYVSTRNGRLKKEGSPVLDRLNQTLRQGNADSTQALLGTRSPFQVRWTFSGKDLSTGKQVPVAEGDGGAAGALHIRFADDQRTELQVEFPDSAQGIYALTAKAEITDARGERREVTQMFYSHVLSSRDSAHLVATALSEAGPLVDFPRDELLATIKIRKPLGPESNVMDHLERATDMAISMFQEADASRSEAVRARIDQAQILQTDAFIAASDNLITLDELAHMADEVAKFAALK